MTSAIEQTRHWIDRLHAAAAKLCETVSFMEVCGTHTMSAFRCGLHSLMPDNVRLLSGPGCPVCVTSQGDIDVMIEAAGLDSVTLCTYGDMLRVPGRLGSLEQARMRGADVRIVYSTLDAVRFAAANPNRQVIFAAVGFETTAPATVAALLEAESRRLPNFTTLTSHKRLIPAMHALMESGSVKVAGFLCPGHVSVIIGEDAYKPFIERYQVPCVIGGFEPAQMAAGLACLVEQSLGGVARLDNLYPQAVTADGNKHAMSLIDRFMTPTDAHWRGIGVIPQSGYALRPKYQHFDALNRFGLKITNAPEPRGCRCGDVITARCTPADCRLFGSACNPIHPVGPCMVSSEGTCQAWFKYHRDTVAVEAGS